MKGKHRVLGIDFGLARMGLAISDERHVIAFPLQVVQASKKAEETVKIMIAAIRDIEKKYESSIAEIIVGNPLMMNGKIGFLADEVRHFTELLQKNIEIPIKLWDERLTSVQADKALREGQMSRKKRAGRVDCIAAVLILQSYLDSTIN